MKFSIATVAAVASLMFGQSLACDPNAIDEKLCPAAFRVNVVYDGTKSVFDYVSERGIALGTAKACNPCLNLDTIGAGTHMVLLNNQQDPSRCPKSKTYMLQSGDTMGKIAAGCGGMQALLNCNPQIPADQIDTVNVGMVIDVPTA
jgi:hypothetical protein